MHINQMNDVDFMNFAKAYLPNYSEECWTPEEKKNLLSFMKCIHNMGWSEGIKFQQPIINELMRTLSKLS